MSGSDSAIHIEGIYLLILAMVVLYAGELAIRKIPFLAEYNIPSAVIGGLACSLVLACAYGIGARRITFATELRDFMLLAFFGTVGLSAKLLRLQQYLRTLLVLLVLAMALLIFQNMAGSAIAAAIGLHPAYGLLAGSISFVGGVGTSVAWSGIFAERFGLTNADDTALVFATAGLVLGGLVGGPLARHLIVRHGLSGDRTQAAFTPSADDPAKQGPVSLDGMIGAVLLVAICVGAGTAARPWLVRLGLTVPDFVIALTAGAVLTNLADMLKLRINVNAVGLISDVSLQVFLAITVMSIELWLFVGSAGPALALLALQLVLMVAFVYLVVFPVMGRDYDASVICAGFAGFGLGATPVGLANMRTIAHRYGASPKAFLVVPLVGAFLIDLANAFVIQLYLASPVLE